MNETPHTVLANDKFRHLLDDVGIAGHLWAGRIHFHHINKKYDSGLEGLIKMSDLVMRQMTSRSPNAVHTALLEGKLRHDLLKELAILVRLGECYHTLFVRAREHQEAECVEVAFLGCEHNQRESVLVLPKVELPAYSPTPPP